MRTPHRLRAPALVVACVLLVSALPRSLIAQGADCTVAAADLFTDAEEQAALDAINALRTESRLSALVPSAPLGQAATWKSLNMASTGHFSHDDAGRGWVQRLIDCGYRWQASENIAVGVESGRAAVQMWRESSLHAANMLDPAARVVGVARARSAGNVWYWTAVFGRAADPTPPDRPTPTPTAMPSGTATAAPQAGSMPAAALRPGAATVNAGPGDCLNVRTEPSLAATVLACLADGTPVTIAAGPREADGITWWQLAGIGWAAGEFLRPAAAPTPAPPR